ncbi:gustatory receptor 200 [Tribolium castaneum]|uniref:Gustatory receptor n=1 Tax=Tribolium castaneum TaxID=7070 RepID=D6WMV0_TRICA|nr:gustatory receptor 200 [Tribolium castaneum]
MNITETAIIICKIWSFTGLPQFKYKNGKFEYKKTKSYVILTLVVMTNIAFFIKSLNVTNDLMFYLSILQTGSLYSLDIGLIIYSYLKKRKIVIILNDLLMVTKMVCRVSRNNNLSQNNISKSLFWYIIVQVILVAAEFLGILVFFTLEAKVYVNLVFYNFATFFSYNLNVLIFFYLIVVRTIYTSYFNAITSNSTNDPKTVIRIFTKLYEISHNINETFQVPILLRIFTDFVLSVTTVFYLSVTLYFFPGVSYYVVLVTVAWLTNILFAIFMMAYFFDQTTEMRNTMTEIIDDLPSSHSLSKMLSNYKKVKELLRLKLKHEDFCFNVCGFFPLNISFIYMMVAGITMYTIYLLQFGPINNQKLNPQVQNIGN